MTQNFLYLSFSTLYSSSLRRTDTIVVSKLNKPPLLSPPSLLSTPSNGLEINKPPGGLNRGFTVLAFSQALHEQNRSARSRAKNWALTILIHKPPGADLVIRGRVGNLVHIHPGYTYVVGKNDSQLSIKI